MRYLVVTLCLVFACGVCSLNGQEVQPRDYRTVFVVPRDVILPVVAAQPDCPLQFEEVKHVKRLNGGSWNVYRLRNRGTKPIRAYTVAELSTGGPAWTSSWPRKRADELFLPGEVHPRPGESTQIEIVPLTEQLRLEAKLPEPMDVVAVLMIVRVEFADGTVYSDEQTHKALQSYFQKIALLLELKEQERRFEVKKQERR